MAVGLATLDLWESLRQPGCPVCRVREKAERRYATSLLWENVNDPGVRARLLASQGFCGTHARLLLNLAGRELGSRLGLAIIYEHLTRELLHRVGGLRHPTRASRRVFGPARPPAHRQLRGLLPTGECPICVVAREAAERNLWFLVENLGSAEWQDAWRDSDGLCRSHLLRGLALAAAKPEVFDFLWQDAIGRLESLRHHLAEFIRKQAWEHRDEPVSTVEAGAVDTAVAFFTGGVFSRE